jgi:hypothetical protein
MLEKEITMAASSNVSITDRALTRDCASLDQKADTSACGKPALVDMSAVTSRPEMAK